MIETEIHFTKGILPKGHVHNLFLPCVFPIGTTIRIHETKYYDGESYQIYGCFKITSIGFDTIDNYMILTVESVEDWIETLEMY